MIEPNSNKITILEDYNTGLAKVAVQYSADTFVFNQSLVLRLNICGEIRHYAKPRTAIANKNSINLQ